MKTLHFVPLPFPAESPFSLIRRAALMNGYNVPKKFLSAFLKRSIVFKLVYQDSEVCKLLSENAREHASSIRDRFYSPQYSDVEKPRISINGTRIPAKYIRHIGAAICTECLSEGWERDISIIKLSHHCPYHLRTYLKNCPACNRHFTWYNQATNICTCNHTLVSPACSASEAMLEKGLLELMQPQSKLDFDLFNRTLNSLTTKESTNSHESNRLRIEIALNITINSGKGVSQPLIQLCNFKTGINIKFALAKLSTLTPKSTLNIIANEMRLIVSEDTISDEIPSGLTSRQVMNYLNLKDYAWKLAFNDPRFPRKKKSALYTQENINLIEIIIKEKESETHKKEATPKGTVTFAEARAMLKVKANIFRELLQGGLIGTPIKSNTGKLYINKEAINKFTTTFITIQALRKKLRTRSYTIRKIIEGKTIKTTPLPHGDLYTTIFQRNDIDKIQELLASRRSFKTPLKNQLDPIKEEDRQKYISANEARKIIRFPRDLVTQLAKSNLIPNCRKGRPNNRILIPISEVQNIATNFITCSEIASKCLLPNKQVAEILSRHGVLPVTGPSVDGQTHHAFRRSDITRELICKINTSNDSFSRAWMNGDSISATDAAAVLGIRISDLYILRQHLIAPSRPLHHQGNPWLSPQELSIISTHLKNHVSIDQVSKLSGMTKSLIHRLFLPKNRGRLIININSTPHIPKGLADNIITFPESFLTYRAADALLGAPSGYTRTLIKENKISKAERPNYCHSRMVLIRKQDIEKIRLTL